MSSPVWRGSLFPLGHPNPKSLIRRIILLGLNHGKTQGAGLPPPLSPAGNRVSEWWCRVANSPLTVPGKLGLVNPCTVRYTWQPWQRFPKWHGSSGLIRGGLAQLTPNATELSLGSWGRLGSSGNRGSTSLPSQNSDGVASGKSTRRDMVSGGTLSLPGTCLILKLNRVKHSTHRWVHPLVISIVLQLVQVVLSDNTVNSAILKQRLNLVNA